MQSPRERALAWWVAAATLILAAGVVFLGPKHTVVCTFASFPDTLFGDTFGHTDGASFTGCDVPTTGTWIVATAMVVWGFTRAAIISLRWRR